MQNVLKLFSALPEGRYVKIQQERDGLGNGLLTACVIESGETRDKDFALVGIATSKDDSAFWDLLESMLQRLSLNPSDRSEG